MTNFSLPVISERGRAARGPLPPVDRTKPYKSCIWLEGGLAFNRRSLNACLIAHHDTGYPHLCDFNGGEVNLEAVLAAKEQIIAENQLPGGHPSCRGCPHLVAQRWPKRRRPIRLIGIAQFSRCNIECSYCYLQTDDPAKFIAGYDPYAVLPALRALVARGVLDRQFIVDWGGGEPTIYPEFDDALELLTRAGATTWVHTNGTRVPRPIRHGLPTRRLNILCSVDAGTRETWQLIKRRDLLPIVWRNLAEYVRLGARVVLKYIVTDENCAEPELRAFLAAAVATGARELVLDIDYNHPVPSPAVIAGLRTLRRLGPLHGLYTTFGSTGANYTPEVDVRGSLNGGPDRAIGQLHWHAMQSLAWLRSRAALACRRLG